MRVVRVKLWLLGERDFPEAVVTLPAHVVSDFPDLLARARGGTPGVSMDSVLYSVWRLGSRRLDENLARGIPIRVADLPFVLQAAPYKPR